MEPTLIASNANFKMKSVDETRSISGFNENEFSNELKLAKADVLLRNTSQYEKWEKLCQNNGEAAIGIADILLNRHAMLEQSKKGQPVNWSLFDSLTQKLKKNNISLFESSELSRKNSSLPSPPLKEVPINNINNVNPSNIRQNTAGDERIQTTETTETTINNTKDEIIQPTEKTINNTENEPFELSDETFLLLNIYYDKNILGENMVGYGDSQNLFLPLGELSQTLDFSIDTDADKGTAKGWFISEGRTFNLDLTKMEVMVDGKKEQLPEKSVMIADDELYVDNKLLSKWFPVDFNFDYSKMAIGIETREKLPFQERMERNQGWNISRRKHSNQTKFPREKSEYDLLGPQFVDINIGNSYQKNTRNGTHSTGSSFNILSRGDLAKMSSEIYLAGNSSENLNDARITLKRVDPDANLLGPLKATSVAVGDIYTTEIPEIGENKREIGVSISNKELNRSSNFDTTFFEGSLPPGWDVEVYRNSALMASKRIGADGKYYFDEMPVNYGKNHYKLVFYGPQGQKRIETKDIDVGSNILKKGQGEYNISLTQKNTNVYDTEDINRLDQETPKVNATFDYGINEKISMGVGLSSQDENSERHNYMDLNANGNYKDIRLRGDYIKDTKGGDALMGLAQTQIKGVDLNFSQKLFNDLRQRDYLQTDISASGIIQGNSLMPDLRTGLSLQNFKNEYFNETSLGSSISANMKDTKLTNNLTLRNTRSDTDDSTGMDGNFNISGKIKDLRLSGRLGYDIKPNTEITEAALSAAYNITDTLSSSLYIKKNMESNKNYEGSVGLNWNINNGKFIISPSMSYNNDENLTAMLNFSTSLGIDPKTKKFRMSSTPMGQNGTAVVNVYNDKNNNSVFDQGDEIIEGPTVKAVQSYRKAETDEDGVAVIENLQNYRPTDILINKETLEDPFWEPKTQGVSIVPRPAHIQEINIPVIGTGEIDGTVYRELKDKTEIPYTNARMQLLDESGNIVQETRSEYDGFYLFTKVPHGNYQVRIDPDQLQKKGLGEALLSDMNIKAEDNVLSGNDFYLTLLSNEKTPAATVEEPQIASAIEKPDEKETTTYAAKVEKPDVIVPVGGPVKDNMKKAASVEPVRVPKVDKAEPKKDVAWAAVEKADAIVPQHERFGVHLSSYRTSEKAIAGIDDLRKKYKNILGDAEFTVKKVHVSDEKGIWFRVFAGVFDDKENAEQLKRKIKMAEPYCRVLSLGSESDTEANKGVHLTSFRTTRKAKLSIQELKEQYPVILKDADFTIKSADLGPEMGKWERVIAGDFSNEEDAKRLAKRIKMNSPYGKTMQVEENEEFGVHLASFKTCEKASRGLKILQKKFSSTLNQDDFSIRRVDLGEKGIWYRIFSGRFKAENEAIQLMNSLKKMNQYAMIINFSNQDFMHL